MVLPLLPIILPALPSLAAIALGIVAADVVGKQVVQPIVTPKAVEAREIKELPREVQTPLVEKTDFSTLLLIVGGGLLLFFALTKK